MDCLKLGALIKKLRIEKGMTQRQLAEKLNLSSKTVSKWENGLGCPDVSLLGALSAVLEVNLESMLSGELPANRAVGGNMQKMRYFVCRNCGNIALSTGNAEISCCGMRLRAMEAERAEGERRLKVEAVEDEWFISSDHPMQKDHFISFVAFVRGDRIEMHKLFPEWNLQLRMQKRGRGKLVWYDTKDGLYQQLI